MNWFSYRHKLRKLQAETSHELKRFRKAYAPVAQGDDAARDAVWKAHGEKSLKNDIAIQELKSNWLVQEAINNDVPVPDMLFMGTDNEFWFRSPFHRNTLILKEHARADMRADIWEVQRQRWERWSRWVPLLTGLTGLFGAAIGLIAALSKWL